MSWRYFQLTGQLFTPAGKFMASGYSGNGAGKNNPAFEQVANVGPIPKGSYDFGALFDSPEHGPHCLRLNAMPGTDTHGRSGFLVHGDSIKAPGTASKGCVCQPRFAREAMGRSDDKILEVA